MGGERVKHLGDITKIDWFKVEPVDVVTGGSPCQDLSVAGKRAGLAGERSGLFMEQIRCVKELREADAQRGRTGNLCRPRFMVWENVPGAFSSGNPKGADFAAVIEEIIKVAEPNAVVRVLPPDKGWNKSGCYYSVDGRWSVAWRLHDAQFWGVPQRRKRIALVADFGGLSAPEILFERKGLSRNIEQGGEERQEAAGAVGGGVEGAIGIDLYNQTTTGSKSKSLNSAATDADHVPCVMAVVTNVLASSAVNAERTDGSISPSLMARAGTGGNQLPIISTMAIQRSGEYKESEVASCCNSGDYKSATDLVVGNKAAIRRLTPLECERLQGYPDGWTDIGEWIDTKGKKHKEADSPRYKALGNSIALPFWKWLLKRISAQYERDATLGSLFDGIGGFPLCWEQVNGKGSARWASEIEEFLMAVTKLRFGEE
jgi:DNA (cytosine-5)-methyltransferase 1